MAKVTKVVSETVIPDDAVDDTIEEQSTAASAVPLFPSAGLDPSKIPGGIAVTREDPPDGYIGYYPPTTTKEDLKRLVGGYVLSLELKDRGGKMMKGGGQIMLRIDAPPVASASAKANLEELRKGSTFAQSPDQFARILEIQRTAIDEIRTRTNDSVAIMRAELEGSAARRAAEGEAVIRRMQEEAKIRAEEAENKHKREMELARANQEAQLTREREQRALEAKQHTEMIGMIQHNAAQQTQLVVASMANRTDPMQVITQLMTLAAPLLPMLSGQGDPAVEITKAVSSSLESMTRMVVTDKPLNGNNKPKEIARGNGASKGLPAPEGSDAKQRIIAKVGKLFQAVQSAGQDPEAILDGAIAHYENQGKQEEVEPDEDEEQTPGHAAKRSDKPVRRRKKSVALARRRSSKPEPAGKPAVGRRPKAHGKPKVAGRSRRDPPGGKHDGPA